LLSPRPCFSSSPRSANHRDLHSFPTRRSSDLEACSRSPDDHDGHDSYLHAPATEEQPDLAGAPLRLVDGVTAPGGEPFPGERPRHGGPFGLKGEHACRPDGDVIHVEAVELDPVDHVEAELLEL